MIELNKNNISTFLDYYHYLHDSYITNINYDIHKSKIELQIDVVWSGEPILKENGVYQTNPTKLNMVFDDIEECHIKEIFDWII